MAPAGMIPTPPPGAYPPPTQQSNQYGQPQSQQQAYGAPPPNPYGPQYPQPPGAVQGPMPSYGFGQYEFNDMENGIIAKTASRARIWGVAAIVTGSLW
jgi:hypothetical protein